MVETVVDELKLESGQKKESKGKAKIFIYLFI